jgi:proteasome assembly chaperone (PAC2) family protein
MVAAFGGWGDAAEVATTAVSFLLRNRDTTRVREFDAEDLFVYTQTRPGVRTDESGNRRITWPAVAVTEGRGGPRDVLALSGPEPNLRWKAFARDVVDLWRERGQGGPVVLLGAFLAGIAHNAPVVLTGFATTSELRGKLFELGVQPSGYEGPTGIHSVLAEAFEAAGVPCVSIWAAVPHYLGAMPNPKACAAVLRAVDRLLELGLDVSELDDAARTFEQQVNLAMTRAGQMVSAAEPQPAAEQPQLPAEPLPSADEMVQGVEDFLRRNKPTS